MFDLLKRIIEIIAQSFNLRQMAEARKRKQLTGIGADLFLLYANINDILICGRQIVSCLRSSVSRFNHHLQDGDKSYVCNEAHMPRLLCMQRLSLIRLVSHVSNLREYLMIVSSDSYTRLIPLAIDKISTLEKIARIMEDGDLPLHPIAEDLLEQITAVKSIEDPRWDHNDQIRVYRMELNRHLFDTALRQPGNLTREQYEKLSDFLTHYDPDARLNSIEEIAKAFRECLIKTFSAEELMLEVGKEKHITFGRIR